MPWFRKKKGKIEPVSDAERVVRTENVFVRCDECTAHLYKRELEDNLQVCVHCNYHFRMGAYERLERLFDDAYCEELEDRKSTRLNSSHMSISYAVFCLKKKKK